MQVGVVMLYGKKSQHKRESKKQIQLCQRQLMLVTKFYSDGLWQAKFQGIVQVSHEPHKQECAPFKQLTSNSLHIDT